MHKKNMLLIGLITFFVLPIKSIKSVKKLEQYRSFLEKGTYQRQNWSSFVVRPKSRYDTFKKAFEHFEKYNGKIIVELGTTRSFVDGKYRGCLSPDPQYWQPYNPMVWDWGAGSFTRVAAECLVHLNPEFHSVDISGRALSVAQIMVEEFAHIMHFHKCSSVDFLHQWDTKKKIDLIYLDTGDMNEYTCKLQLQEVKVIVERDLLAPNGIIVIDDVKNQTPIKRADKTVSHSGKSEYSLAYLLSHGFKIMADEYQVILARE